MPSGSVFVAAVVVAATLLLCLVAPSEARHNANMCVVSHFVDEKPDPKVGAHLGKTHPDHEIEYFATIQQAIDMCGFSFPEGWPRQNITVHVWPGWYEETLRVPESLGDFTLLRLRSDAASGDGDDDGDWTMPAKENGVRIIGVEHQISPLIEFDAYGIEFVLTAPSAKDGPDAPVKPLFAGAMIVQPAQWKFVGCLFSYNQHPIFMGGNAKFHSRNNDNTKKRH